MTTTQKITIEHDDINPHTIHLVRSGEYIATVFDEQGVIPGRGRYAVMQAPAGCEKFYADLDDLKRDLGEPESAEVGPKAWTGRQTRIVTVKGKRYCVETTITERGEHAYVNYWSERNGQTFGATRSCSGRDKPGTVGHAIWEIASK